MFFVFISKNSIMAESSELQKKPVNPKSNTSLQEKKPFVGIPKTNPFTHNNSSFNKSWFTWRSGGGRPAVRKHAARSR